MKPTKKCERCKFFQTRQGKGKFGDCKLNPVEVEKKPSDWCGQYSTDLTRYHVDGKKIYTRIDTKKNLPNAVEDAYRDFSGDDSGR